MKNETHERQRENLSTKKRGGVMDSVPTFTPQQLEFLASDTLTEIIPTVSFDHASAKNVLCLLFSFLSLLKQLKKKKFPLMGGTFGPMEPQVPVSVPLWLAVHLRKRNRCRIRPPAWLAKAPMEALLKVWKEEEEGEGERLPFFCFWLNGCMADQTDGEGFGG